MGVGVGVSDKIGMRISRTILLFDFLGFGQTNIASPTALRELYFFKEKMVHCGVECGEATLRCCLA